MQVDPPFDSSFESLEDGFDGIPVVIVGRLRLADRVAKCYAMRAVLFVDEEQSSPDNRYFSCIVSDDSNWTIPWVITDPTMFHTGLRAIYTLLEQLRPTGKTLGQLFLEEVEESSIGNTP